ncbi:hypothetical protein N7530_011812 [Penicillium desertorum]|uniref:NADH:flavin oxidoreductase/NADH oxidase N-terminal domain-containing protein n=1 Tax=Penicillium desertorum TaxID=1303715 RepID=A0A9X0BG52_9EURO|nr:hypothetical protein N7530_011812 [Penicillium desertorum]
MSASHISPLAQPITLKLSGKITRNRLYRTPLSEYASTNDENNVENCGKPMDRYASRAVIGTTGGWRDSHRMSEAVERGDIDMCGLGRPLREDPDIVNKVLRGEVRRSNL